MAIVGEAHPDAPPGNLYQSHKRVRAFCIAEIRSDEPANPDLTILVPDDENLDPIAVSAEYMKKHEPKVGGYWVQYADGYQSWSPANAFESGYTIVTE